MRGKLRCNFKLKKNYRITPADAGKTLDFGFNPAYVQDHPRGCGENQMALQGAPLQAGITPADAGKTKYVI